MFLHNQTIDLVKFPATNSLYSKIGLGTDSKFSNNDLNIINEAKFIKNKTGLGLLKLLDMLTINAARILRLDNETGSLEKGKDADFLVFKLKKNESYTNFIDKEKPESVYVQGNAIVLNKELVNSID
jgi:imidazolonepropionase-like amidohydrolase